MRKLLTHALVFALSCAPAYAQSTASTTILQLPSAGPLTGSEIFPIDQLSGLVPTTKQTSINAMALFLYSHLPPASAAVPGGILASSAPSHQYVTGVSTAGVIGYAQPSFADLLGIIAPSQIPVPSPTTLGGVLSGAASANQFQTGISSAGAPTFAQPSFANLSGLIALGQIPTGAAVANIGYAPLNRAGDSMTGNLTFGPVSPSSIVNLFTTQPPDDYTGLNGSGAVYSYIPWTGGPIGTDTIRAANYMRMKTTADVTHGETDLALDCYMNTGGGGAPPAGPNPGKVCLSITTALGANASNSWGAAFNTIFLPGWNSNFGAGQELDVGQLSADCYPGSPRCVAFNLFLYGFTKFPTTATIDVSTPGNTPPVVAPIGYAPSQTVAAGAVENNGGHAYQATTGGTTASSGGGPTGTTPGTNINDGSVVWTYYGEVFQGLTGGATHYGILISGVKNNVANVAFDDATNAQIGFSCESGTTKGVACLKDATSGSTSAMEFSGSATYATINEHSTAPFGIWQQGTYSGAAYRYQDVLIGAGGVSGYSAISFNQTLSSGYINGWFGKSSDLNIYGNTQGAYHLRVGNADAAVLSAGELDAGLSATNVNYPAMVGNSTGFGALIAARGADTNVSLQLQGKGAGQVQALSTFAVEANLLAPNLATAGGTVAGTLCVDTTGLVYVKTTSGACK